MDLPQHTYYHYSNSNQLNLLGLLHHLINKILYQVVLLLDHQVNHHHYKVLLMMKLMYHILHQMQL